MRSLLVALVFGLALSTWSLSEAHAAQPGYVILRTQSGHHGRWVSPGRAYPVQGQGYAWGWFGATRHTNSYYHNGYYGNFRQRTDW